jgi:hypothetical protein
MWIIILAEKTEQTRIIGQFSEEIQVYLIEILIGQLIRDNAGHTGL